jgi:hypothetical protein
MENIRVRKSAQRTPLEKIGVFYGYYDRARGQGLNRLHVFAVLLISSAYQEREAIENKTILLGGTYNMNTKCGGHAEGLCGTEGRMLPTEIAGIFATEPDCQGPRLRGLTDKERGTPSNQLPFLASG